LCDRSTRKVLKSLTTKDVAVSGHPVDVSPNLLVYGVPDVGRRG
jgi:hypothetical protein